MSLGKRLRIFREQRTLPQEDLAKSLNLTKATISRCESEVRQPNLDIIKEIARLFDVSVDFLTENTESRTPKLEPHIIPGSYQNFDTAGLPDEAIRQIEDYIEFVKSKYSKPLEHPDKK